MKSLAEKLEKRRQQNRPSTTITISVPADLIEDLEEMASVFGFGSLEALARSYVAQGLRRDEQSMEQPEIRALHESLKRHGMSEQAANEIVAETLAGAPMASEEMVGQRAALAA